MLNYKENTMTFFSTPMARQFVGFDTLFEELNSLADRKEPNYPAYNIAKDDDEQSAVLLRQETDVHWRCKSTDSGGRSATKSNLRTKLIRVQSSILKFRNGFQNPISHFNMH